MVVEVVVQQLCLCLLCSYCRSLHTHTHTQHMYTLTLTPHSSPSQDHSSVLAAEEVLTVQRVLKTKGHTFSDEQVGMEGGEGEEGRGRGRKGMGELER